MDATFKALADPTRRELLDRLLEKQGQTLTELVDGLGIRRQSVAKHLAVLEAAGLVSCQWHGREKLHYLNPMPIAEISRHRRNQSPLAGPFLRSAGRRHPQSQRRIAGERT
jgi:DNA-binding transcriptional ArsR family regulator